MEVQLHLLVMQQQLGHQQLQQQHQRLRGGRHMLQRLSSKLLLRLQQGLLLLVVMRRSMSLAQSLISSRRHVALQQVTLMVLRGLVVLVRSCHQRCEPASSRGA
jgi:hypothetical protein